MAKASAARSSRTLFAPRFVDRYAGKIVRDPVTAIVELIANAWDARATKVEITWPTERNRFKFSIRDNGIGMSDLEVRRRWQQLDYDRLSEQGKVVSFPAEMNLPDRIVYGRNGKGRFAAFHFGKQYILSTCKEGTTGWRSYRVTRGLAAPIELEEIEPGKREGQGTEILIEGGAISAYSEEVIRSEIGMRFLSDPTFSVIVNRHWVVFDDITQGHIQEKEIPVPGHGSVTMYLVDTHQTDRTARQHGVAWRVQNRLVGKISWKGKEQEPILDGRTAEAKRYSVVIKADILADAVEPDWSGFDQESEIWKAVNSATHEAVREVICDLLKDERGKAGHAVKKYYSREVQQLSPISRARWNSFVDNVIISCPSITERDLIQLAGILAKLELSTQKYRLLEQLHTYDHTSLDSLSEILKDWSIGSAKIVLDELKARVKLLDELEQTLANSDADEVKELQPLFQQGLWIFGPEFETIEFTSNRGMTAVIRELFRIEESGSRDRPDFVVLPDSSVGLYSYPSYDEDGGEDGVSKVVIVELKAPDVWIGTDEKAQAWKYVSQLHAHGCITDQTEVICWVLGTHIEPRENQPRTEGPNVQIRPLKYDTFTKRARSRLMNLYDRIKDAPFLNESAVKEFVSDGLFGIVQ